VADLLAREIAQLYRLPPGEFLRARNTRAAALRKAGKSPEAQALSQLRRPSAPLWATNQLAHEDPRRLARFVDSVQQVRRIQLSDPRAVGEALRQQRAQLDALVGLAAELLARHGQRTTSETHRRISDTLLGAAVAGPRAEELREGRLTDELSAPGFEVLAGAPRGNLRLVPPGQTRREPEPARPPRTDRVARAKEERERRDREAAELERTAAARQAAVAEAAREAEELARKLAAARERVREAQRASKAAGAAARNARRRVGR
jgi:hypothetical protein